MKRLVHILCCILKYAQDCALWVICSAAVLHILGSSGMMRMVTTALIVVPAGCYLVKVLRDRVVPVYEETVRLFPGEAAAVMIGGLICRYEGRNWGLTAAVLFLITGVFLMRMLRQEREGNLDSRSFALEIGLTVLFSGICVFFSRPEVDQVILQALSALLSVVMTLVIYGMSGILYVVIWIVSHIFGSWDGFSTDLEQFTIDFQTPIKDMEEAETAGMNPWAGRIASIILVLLLIAVAILLFRRLWFSMKRQPERRRKGAEIERSHSVVRRENYDAVPITDRSARAKVRRAYASFLRDLSAAGYSAEISDTTADINEKLVPQEYREPAEQLRALYLRARYSEEGSVTAEEGAEAARLAKQLRRIGRS